MKKLIFTLCLFVSLAGCNSNQKQSPEITAFVNQWNLLHNTKDMNGFTQLYAATVQFYGTIDDRSSLLAKIQKYIDKDNSQEIITPIDIRYYKSGNIKCNFTKRINRAGKINEYPSYLVLQKQDGKYLITVESDLKTDQKKNVEMKLGDEVGSVNTSAMIIIALCCLVAGGGIFYIYRKRHDRMLADKLPIDGSIYLPKEESAKINEVPIVIPNISKVKQLTETEKGYEFEKHVVEKFDVDYFTIKEWRSDKYHKGIYPKTSKYPDLEIEYNSISKKRVFAVECKWRKGFTNGTVKLGEEGKLREYINYAKEFRQEVFIVLGVGGSPDNPESIYIIPLSNFVSTTYTQYQLKEYLRNKSGNFFFDVPNMMLY